MQMGNLLTQLESQIQTKGKELVEYREKYNIKLQNEAPAEKPVESSQSDSKSSGVLVTS